MHLLHLHLCCKIAESLPAGGCLQVLQCDLAGNCAARVRSARRADRHHDATAPMAGHLLRRRVLVAHMAHGDGRWIGMAGLKSACVTRSSWQLSRRHVSHQTAAAAGSLSPL